jgi:hypothetical protein
MTRKIALRTRRSLALAAVAVLALGACGDEDADRVVDGATELAEQSAVRVQAEALRALLKQKADGDADRYRSMTVLQDALDDLPGDVTSTGLTDSDGDGRDDDGRVQLEVRNEQACLSVIGTDTTVENGPCE